MKIKKPQFLISSPDLAHLPKSNLPEFALLGRSNVGKSTFINAISNNSKLAKTSNTPGKTRLINLFNFDDLFMIADLPGYGYAKVSKAEQANWQKSLEEYLLKRENLISCVQFIDVRHEIQKNDFQMYDWLVKKELNSFCILTKCDYISRNEIAKKIKRTEDYLGLAVFPFSNKNSYYNEAILKYIENIVAK